jgi:TRAP-type C4-dicarboxylate transport system permease small subunit
MEGTYHLSRRFGPWVRWIAFLGFLFLLLIAVAIVLDVLLRWLFDAPIEWVDDLSQLAFAVAIAACFPAGLLQGHNIAIRFLGKGVGRRGAHWLEFFGALLTLIFFAFVAWQFVVLVIESYGSGDTTMTVQAVTWPWWLVTAVIVIFCVPVQVAVFLGHGRRAVSGEEPGGTVEPEGTLVDYDMVEQPSQEA